MISAFMSAKDNTERVQPTTYDMKHDLTRKATATETHELRSVTLLKDLRECNRMSMQSLHPHAASTFSQTFLGMMQLSQRSVSFCHEQEQLDGITQNFKSQQACITAPAPECSEDAHSPFGLEFNENHKSLSQYIDGRSLRIMQCC